MRGFLGALLGAALFSLVPSISLAGDWDFTTEDYSKLIADGGQLNFSNDSRWIPLQFRQNILATLNSVLHPSAKKRNTWGVTPRDLFHGHIVCRRPNTLNPENGFVHSGIIHREMNEKIRDAVLPFANDDWNWDVSMLLTQDPGAVAVFPELRKRITREWTRYLQKQLHDCDQAAVVYHTFEFARPSHITSDDPRRHLETSRDPGGEFVTREISTPNYWNSLHSIYDEFFEFQFLINEKGVIYLQPGTDYFFLTMPGFTLNDLKRCSATTTSLPEDKLD